MDGWMITALLKCRQRCDEVGLGRVLSNIKVNVEAVFDGL